MSVIEIVVIMTNYCYRESKRKTAAVVALRNNERIFGDAALNTVSKTGIERESSRRGEQERESASTWLTCPCVHCVVRKVLFLCTRWPGLSRICLTKQEGSMKLRYFSFLIRQAVKYPKSAYRYLQLLIGQKFESPLVQKYKEWFPFYDLKKDEERGM